MGRRKVFPVPIEIFLARRLLVYADRENLTQSQLASAIAQLLADYRDEIIEKTQANLLPEEFVKQRTSSDPP